MKNSVLHLEGGSISCCFSKILEKLLPTLHQLDNFQSHVLFKKVTSCLAAPRGLPAAGLRARRVHPGGPFWVLGGYFPSGPTSLPVKESEVGAGPPATSGSTPAPRRRGARRAPPRAPLPVPPHPARGPPGSHGTAPARFVGRHRVSTGLSWKA